MGEAYLGAKPAVWVSRAPLLSRDECARAIASAETWAKRNGGWSKPPPPALPAPLALPELPPALPEPPSLREPLSACPGYSGPA
jgi:hypothetical protein